MNERIKELSRLAQTFANANCEDEFGSVDESKRKNVFQEKFAELIVRECLSKVTEAVYAREMSGRYYPDSDGKKILKHFGVEE